MDYAKNWRELGLSDETIEKIGSRNRKNYYQKITKLAPDKREKLIKIISAHPEDRRLLVLVMECLNDPAEKMTHEAFPDGIDYARFLQMATTKTARRETILWMETQDCPFSESLDRLERNEKSFGEGCPDTARERHMQRYREEDRSLMQSLLRGEEHRAKVIHDPRHLNTMKEIIPLSISQVERLARFIPNDIFILHHYDWRDDYYHTPGWEKLYYARLEKILMTPEIVTKGLYLAAWQRCPAYVKDLGIAGVETPEQLRNYYRRRRVSLQQRQMIKKAIPRLIAKTKIIAA